MNTQAVVWLLIMRSVWANDIVDAYPTRDACITVGSEIYEDSAGYDGLLGFTCRELPVPESGQIFPEME